jgi:CHAT domain-containing protein/Tfp pilus assembly protein PilF
MPRPSSTHQQSPATLLVFVCICLLKPLPAQTQDSLAARLLLEKAEMALKNAHYADAISLAGQSLKQFSTALGSTHKSLAEAHATLGYAYLESGNYPFALRHFTEELQQYSKLLGEEHPKTAQAHNDLGNYFFRIGNLQAAMKEYETAANIRLQILSENHADSADSYDNIGLVLAASGDYAQALEFHQKALAIRTKLLPKAHEDLALSHQNIGNCFYFSGYFSDANLQYQKALSIRQKTLGKNHPKTAQILNNLGNCALETSNFQKAFDYYAQAVDVYEKTLGKNHPDLAQALANMGNCLANTGQKQAAVPYFERALAIDQKKFGVNNAAVADIYDNLGHAALDAGDVEKAKSYYTQALGIRKKLFKNGHPYLAFSYENMGLYYQAIGQTEQALANHLAALDIRKKVFWEDSAVMGGNYNNIANCYLEKGDKKNAMLYYEKSIGILSQAAANGQTYAQALANMGKLLAAKGEWKKALADLNKAADIAKTNLPPNSPLMATYYKDIGLANAKLKRFDNALYHYGLALKALELDNTGELAPTNTAFANEAIYLLTQRGQCRLDMYKATPLPDLLEHASKDFKAAIDLTQRYAATLSETPTRELFTASHFAAYEGAIQTELWAQRPEAAFTLSEMGKSGTLKRIAQFQAAGIAAMLPDSLLRQEQALEQAVVSLETALHEELLKGSARNEEKMLSLNGALQDAQQRQDGFSRLLQSQYPKYARLNYGEQSITVEEVQEELLRDNHTLLEYFVGDSSIFVFIINKHKYALHSIPKDFPLETWVAEMRRGIQEYFLSEGMSKTLYESSSKMYAQRAWQLYEKLVKPFESELAETLIIVPDGALCALPFDALLREPAKGDVTRFKNHAYMLKKHHISYHFAASLLKAPTGPKAIAPNGRLLAFAPSFAGSGWPELASNQAEAQHIARQMNGDGFYGEAATRQNFLENAPRYGLLHLATHASGNFEEGHYSYLVFAQKDSSDNGRLYAKELYALHLPAKMVTLSACETGSGQLRKGEGLISLARGFFVAGAQSVVTSLWRVNDAKTAELMEGFYAQLAKGLPKDAALRQAKLDYLRAHPHDEAHPFFWAAFVPIGDMSPIEAASRPWAAILLCCLLALASFGVWWFIRAKRKNVKKIQ